MGTTDHWTAADWQREFGDRSIYGGASEHKAREVADLRRTSSSYVADEDDDDLDDAVTKARREVAHAERQQIAARMALDLLEYKSRAAERETKERELARLTYEMKRQTVELALEQKADEIRRTLGDAEIARRVESRRLDWKADQAAYLAYRAEVKAAREHHTEPPPHYKHAAKAYAKWREAQRVLQFRQYGQYDARQHD